MLFITVKSISQLLVSVIKYAFTVITKFIYWVHVPTSNSDLDIIRNLFEWENLNI